MNDTFCRRLMYPPPPSAMPPCPPVPFPQVSNATAVYVRRPGMAKKFKAEILAEAKVRTGWHALAAECQMGPACAVCSLPATEEGYD